MGTRYGKDPTERPGGRRTFRPRPAPLAAVLLAVVIVGCLFAAAAPAGALSVPGRPTAKLPKGTVATRMPTFTWSKASGASKYELRVYQGTKQVRKKTAITKLSWKTSTALPKDVSFTWKVRASNARGASAWSRSLTFKVVVVDLKIGDSYQGGIVAYVLQPWPNLDPGYVAGETHGLIAAPADQNPGIAWSNIQATRVGLTGTLVRTGQPNTTAIVGQSGCTGGAAVICDQLTLSGYSDWYLPSQDELDKLYVNRAAIGGFVTDWASGAAYWSSSEFGADEAWSQQFDTSVQYNSGKGSPFRVRAVRSF